jgi:hypothetical protein
MTSVGNELIPLQKMQGISWACLAVFCLGAGVFFSWFMAWSVFAGGVISIVSFWVSHHDVMLLVGRLTSIAEPGNRQARAKQENRGYLLKFWLRIVIIGVVLLLLIKSGKVNIFGLILGLSTVVFAITFTALNEARHYFFSGRR